MRQNEIIDFIFHTGFSTSEQVTTVSGRGLGMDIVKKTLVREKGSIRIKTEKDLGTRFLLKIQVWLFSLNSGYPH